jgi:hypothetical protein
VGAPKHNTILRSNTMFKTFKTAVPSPSQSSVSEAEDFDPSLTLDNQKPNSNSMGDGKKGRDGRHKNSAKRNFMISCIVLLLSISLSIFISII